MNLPTAATAILASAMFIAACAGPGDDGVGGEGRTIEPMAQVAHPTDPDAAIIRIGRSDGLPSLVIGGDGWAYTPHDSDVNEASESSAAGFAARLRIAPGPPQATPVVRRLLTRTGVKIVLQRADALGLLEEPDEYTSPQVTDVGSTYIDFKVDSGTFEHQAYALGYESESGNRKRLLEFREALDDLEGLVGSDQIGLPEPWTPQRYVVTDRGFYYEVDDLRDGDRRWPDGLDVQEGCVALPIDRFPTGVAGAYTAEIDDETTLVTVVPDLPGDACTP